MKNLLFLCGPNGVGKTTIGREIVRSLPGSAYVDSESCRDMNPNALTEESIPTVAANIRDLIRNYLGCPAVHTVVFSYGFHGRRREVFDLAMGGLPTEEYRFIPVLLWCSEEENIRRMQADHRSQDRVNRALSESRRAYGGVNYPRLDVTNFTAAEAARAILRRAGS